MRRVRLSLAVIAVAALIGAFALPVGAADHLDAPLVQGDGQTDINDLYVFQSPSNPDNAVFVMTVNPLAGVQSRTDFRVWSPYIFEIDTNGDAISDQDFYAVFSPPAPSSGKQGVHVGGSGISGEGNTGSRIPLRDADGKRIGFAHAGLFDDPFFFDLAAFQNGLAFCPGGAGSDFFEGLDVAAIVIEVPKALLGSQQVGVWAVTTDGVFGSQVDRMGRPAINTVLISSDKDAYNAGQPENDRASFGAEVQAALTGLGAADPAALTQVLLPDVLTVDFDQPTNFLNGRWLADDVIDAELDLLTNGAVTTDCVDDTNDFRDTFPYLGRPN